MNTILYRIPDNFFPGWHIKKPFHAKVQYDFKDNSVLIYDVAFSPLCLQYISNTNGLVMQMKKDIANAERKKQVEPVIIGTTRHFIRP